MNRRNSWLLKFIVAVVAIMLIVPGAILVNRELQPHPHTEPVLDLGGMTFAEAAADWWGRFTLVVERQKAFDIHAEGFDSCPDSIALTQKYDRMVALYNDANPYDTIMMHQAMVYQAWASEDARRCEAEAAQE